MTQAAKKLRTAAASLDDLLPRPALKVAGEPRLRLTHPSAGQEELDAIGRALRSGVLNNGPEVQAFEDEFAARHGVHHAIAMANGTDALAAIYLSLGIGPGDEVIVPAMTFVSSATSVLHVGATPVFADIEPETFTVDPASVHARLTDRTKAILAVHYGGQAADMDELTALSGTVGAVVIEDAAQAHGATYRGHPVGGLGVAAMFSFAPNKNVTMGEGGMITTNDPDLAEKARILRNHGQVSPYAYEVVGFNWRMSEIHGAMGRVQLARLDELLAIKRQNARWMAQRLAPLRSVRAPVVKPDRDHTFMLYTLLFDRQADRDRVVEELCASGVESKVYFPSIPLQPIFRTTEWSAPVSEALTGRILSIPFHGRVRQDDLELVASLIERVLPRTT